MIKRWIDISELGLVYRDKKVWYVNEVFLKGVLDEYLRLCTLVRIVPSKSNFLNIIVTQLKVFSQGYEKIWIRDIPYRMVVIEEGDFCYIDFECYENEVKN